MLGPLFLFNNLHSLHHEMPSIPWYRYHAHYGTQRARLIAENGGLVYRTYFDVARRYLFRPHDALRHPSRRAFDASGGLIVAGRQGLALPLEQRVVRFGRNRLEARELQQVGIVAEPGSARRRPRTQPRSRSTSSTGAPAPATSAGIGVNAVDSSTRMPAVLAGSLCARSRCQ